MPWSSLVDTFLAGTKREQEIEVENQSEYDKWLSELYSEIEVFVKRVNELNLEEAEDRHKLFSLIGRFSDRFLKLRERSEASAAPAEVIIKLEELIERMNNASTPVSVSAAYIGNDPFEKAKRKRKKVEREKKQIKRVRRERDEIAEYIQQFTDALARDTS